MKKIQMNIELSLEVPDHWDKADYEKLYRSFQLADPIWEHCAFMDHRVSVVEEVELTDV